MIRLAQIAQQALQTEPYGWAAVGDLFTQRDAAALAASFPCDHFKTVSGYGGEKDYEYEARELIAMGADTISYPEELSKAWLAVAHDLLSQAYRVAISLLSGCDVGAAPMEVNVFHYGPGACLGPHRDLEDKLVTHVLYFNGSWNGKDGGCLSILRSADPADVAAEIVPIVGNSAVLVRSEKSWHAVSRVVNGSLESRRSLTATFYRPGSVSTMWPPDDRTPLHCYAPDEPEPRSGLVASSWADRLRRFTARKK
jgi:SM-20-related protein